MRRIHRVFAELGAWEARAVAFVLGCGIGVLLRMFWVLGVVFYRTIRTESERAPTVYLVDGNSLEAEHLLSMHGDVPPQYVYDVDVKYPIVFVEESNENPDAEK
jgi:hypothetical protein